MSDGKYPLLILGGGPAGMTAALYARRAGIPATIWEEQYMPGGQMATTPEIENIPGILQTDGFVLSETMAEQVKQLGAVIEMKKATGLSLKPGALSAEAEDGQTAEAETIILAMGARRKKMGIPGEEKFAGRGVSYCAVCDGRLARGKTLAVVGGGNTALEDAIHLANLDCTVTLLHRRNEFRGSPHLLKSVKSHPRITIMTPYIPVAVEGENSISGLLVKHVETEVTETLALSAVFVCIGTMANTEPVKNWLELDSEGRINASENTKTGIPGVYAAGDIRKKPLYQIVTATTDGAVAATHAAEFLWKKQLYY